MLKTKKKKAGHVGWAFPILTVGVYCSKELSVDGEVFGVVAGEEMIGCFNVAFAYWARWGMMLVDLVSTFM